jgi:hypothetical protein
MPLSAGSDISAAPAAWQEARHRRADSHQESGGRKSRGIEAARDELRGTVIGTKCMDLLEISVSPGAFYNFIGLPAHADCMDETCGRMRQLHV